jgi:putative Holliday junction resolvase
LSSARLEPRGGRPQFCLTGARIAPWDWEKRKAFAFAIYNEAMDAPANPARGRVMALDVGSRRIGVAVTDPLGITAQGLDTIQRQNKRRDLAALAGVLTKYDVREIVVGLPLRLSGAEGTQSEKMRQFADDLRAHFGLTVHLWDERWTSTQANRLLRETDLSIKKRGQAVDRMAAILILQSWMEAHPSR